MPESSLRPEHELLLLCSRSVLSNNQVERAGYLLSQGLEWNLLVRVAQSHRVFPLLYTNLVRHFPDAVPAHIAAELKAQYLKNCAFNLFLSHQLLHILGQLDAEHIKAVPFKGPVLAQYLYGDINARSFVDLDILVAREDLETAVRLLRSTGYRFDIDLTLAQYLRLAGQGYHAAMIKEHFSFMVELHWELTGGYFLRKMELREVQSRLRKIPFLDQEVVSLSPADLLVYLCIHGNRHFWLQLDYLCCVAELLRKEKELDWDLVFRLADGIGARRMLLLGCHLASEVLGAELDRLVAAKIDHDPEVRRVGGRVVEMLFAGLAEKWAQLSYRNEVRYHWQTMDSLCNWLRICMKPIFQPTHSDWQWLALPAPLAPLYYLLRPVRLGVKYTKKMICHGTMEEARKS